MKNNELLRKAKKKVEQLKKLRADPRYLKTLGKLKKEGLLDVRDIPAYRGQVFLQDALWAAELEPRIFELLPAIVARRPTLFAFLELPPDLDQVVREVKARKAVTPYQGIEAEKYDRWTAFVGRTKAIPKVPISFRLSGEDLSLLADLSNRDGESSAEIIHRALLEYAHKRRKTQKRTL